MANFNTGPLNGKWKGGRVLASNGYILVRAGKEFQHLADVRGYTYEHRVVAEKTIGRRLRRGEQVHHKNGDKSDNRPENLEVTKSARHHHYFHRKHNSGKRMPDEDNPLIQCQCGCGATFLKYDRGNRPRRFVSGHNIQSREIHG